MNAKEELEKVVRLLAQWTGPKTSLWWRLESERARLLVETGKQ